MAWDLRTQPLPYRADAAHYSDGTNSLSGQSGDGHRCGCSPMALSSLVESEIIPRLLLVHSTASPHPQVTGEALITLAEAERFAALPLELEADGLLEEVEAILARGVSAESVFIDLLAPSARYLGEMWEDDRCDFVDVTMGLWRLQEVMREIAIRSHPIARVLGGPRTALFAPMPGDQHSFGALMLDEVFSRAGWHSEALVGSGRRELLRFAADRPLDLIGLTVSCGCPSATISELIRSIRSVSRASNVHILIGGNAVNANPGLVAECGADGTAADGRSALILAERLVDQCGLSSALTA
ncbi:MAG: B12-binding domain-containing protein [Sphingomonadaceae bacterium]